MGWGGGDGNGSEGLVPRKGLLFSTVFSVDIMGYRQYLRVIDVCFDFFWFLLQISFEQILRILVQNQKEYFENGNSGRDTCYTFYIEKLLPERVFQSFFGR